MNYRFFNGFVMVALWVLSLVALGPAWASEKGLLAKVRGDRVNLRAEAQPNAEVAGQVADGTVLSILAMNAEWVEVKPPADIDAWIAAEFLKDDTVVVNKLNARTGPGINHAVLGSFKRGDKVERRGSFGEWAKVVPPENSKVWISRSLVEVENPNAPVPPPPVAPAVQTETIAVSDKPIVDMDPPVLGVRDVEPVREPPRDLKLIPLDGQGRVVQRDGVLKRSPTLFFTAPGSHRLVRREGNTVVTTAYLRGNTTQLNALLDQRLLIRGREYWIENVKAPLIVIESIEKRTF